MNSQEELSRPDSLISVIVMAVRADPRTRRAVRSLLSQDERCTIIVVNSGGGDMRALLANELAQVIIVESESLLFPGGTRNAGLNLVQTPFIAFLACDCVADEGWVRGRLRRHVEGQAMVASAMMPIAQRNLISWAEHLLMFPQRLPCLPEDRTIRYGVSFDRRLFAEYGLFNVNLKSGEDSEFLVRLLPQKPAWATDVVTFHDNCRNITTLLSQQFRRGYHFGIEMRRIYGSHPFGLIRFYLLHSLGAWRVAMAGLRGRQRLWALASCPLVFVAALARVAGIISMMPQLSIIPVGRTNAKVEPPVASTVLDDA